MNFENIPYEMKLWNQWVVWRFEDLESPKPVKVPYAANSGRLASVSNPQTWATYDQCIAALQTGQYSGLGFVLTENDPYAFIDLDDTKGDQSALDKQMQIFNDFESYAERSPSGQGLHIIVKGAIPSGCRRSSIEIYSASRYMTMTGDVYRELPIVEHNELLNALWQQMGKGKASTGFYMGLEEATETDEEIYNRAASAANGDKFVKLFNGDWSDYPPNASGTHSSEADFALIDIIAFYSHNRAQIARMFRTSGLGQRDKAKRDDYVSYMLNKCFDRMLPPVDIDGLKNKIEEIINQRAKEELSAPHVEAKVENQNDVNIETAKSVYSVPPGLVGEIAQFIYSQSPRPVGEISLAGALGLVAGIVGRAYNISGTGLNQYVLLLAPTGTGKEAITSGIDKLMFNVQKTVPAAGEFIGPEEIASPQAVIKYMSTGPNCFVSMVGEFGMYLQQMASPNAPPHLLGLRRFILNVFNKSGAGKILRPSIYSDKDKNTNAIQAPSFSILGESTPEKFYEGLHEGLITEGLLPRITLIEYYGKVPPLQKDAALKQPNFQLIDKLSSLCAQCLMLNNQNKVINVQYAHGVEEVADKFENHCRHNTNSSKRDVNHQLWSRAHMKALKLAGIIAVGINPYDPEITQDILDWSIGVVLNDVNNMLKRFDAGEIGIDNEETKQLTTVSTCIKDYVVSPWPEVSKYAGESMGVLHSNRIVPYAYIQRRLGAVAVFRKDRGGATNAIKRALKTLCERGDLQEISKATLSKDYSTTSLAYGISHPKAFGL